MNRLWVQLTLAFALVVLITVVVVALLADLTAGQAFRQYLAYTDVARFENLREGLIRYYRLHGSWEGVGDVLDQVLSKPVPRMGGRPGTVHWPDSRLRIIVADAERRVVYDSQGEGERKLTRDERAAAQALQVEDGIVGWLVVSRPVQAAILGPLEQMFVLRLRGLLIVGGLLAGVLGILLGLVLSRNLTAPLRRLAAAARAVANGDLEQQVQVDGSAEIAEVGRAFNEMTHALAASERQRQNMVADVAHELRSPLSVIQGNLQAILDDVYPLEKAEISRIYDETRLLGRLVDDLRELALADAGQLRLDIRPIALDGVIASTVSSLSLAAEAQQVHLTVDLPGDLPLVQADPDRVAQVLRNLLLNALRHTPPGGKVTVAAQAQDDVVEISVADTGEGIAAEDLPHVFERFWRADRARSGGGSGLGLSVAQSLVEAQGGRIWAQSTPGVGSVFRFTLLPTYRPPKNSNIRRRYSSG